jgi:hypothetical protein
VPARTAVRTQRRKEKRYEEAEENLQPRSNSGSPPEREPKVTARSQLEVFQLKKRVLSSAPAFSKRND